MCVHYHEYDMDLIIYFVFLRIKSKNDLGSIELVLRYKELIFIPNYNIKLLNET